MTTEETHTSNGKTLLAVHGQGIYFRFGRKKEKAILNDLNITVNSGEIYSLLGPSGCGKTTLLKCIIGQHIPEAGSLKLYGRNPGSKGFFIPGRGVGYMPQDLALYMDMNTEEILTYYGTLYGMGMKKISERINFLVELLEIPSKRKEIQHLSGGQQRRVSFAIALIHKPPLIILDEPTVGVDPLLRKAIWNHLVDLAKNDHLTVIITTHYTEEARQAHTVGLMRNGHLLVERNPEDLIKQCGGSTLEDVFLKLCQRNGSEDEDHETNIDKLIVDINCSPKYLTANGAFPDEAVPDESYMNTKKFIKRNSGTYDKGNNIRDNTIALLPLASFPTELKQDNYGHWDFTATSSSKRVFYLTRKNFLRLKRNIPLLLFTIGICAVEVTIFFLCLSSEPFDLQMAVVNEEEAGLNNFGENFLLSLSDHTFYQKRFHNLTLAFESVKTGQSWATLHIDPEFSTCLVDRVIEGVDVSNETIRCSTVNLVLDTSNYVIAGTVRMSVLESYQRFATELLESLGKNPLLGKMPVDIEEYTYGSKKPATFVDFACPALILCVAYIISIGLTEMSIIAERKHGLLSRALVAGATTTEVLLSFFFALLVLLLLQLLTMLLVTFYGFNVTCNGPIVWCIVAVLLTGICGMSYGFLISSLTDDENAACLIAFGSFFPILLLSAAFWPLQAIPYYLRLFSNCLPLTRIIESMRSVMIRGWNITDNYIWDGYLICSFWIAAQVGLAIIVLKIRK